MDEDRYNLAEMLEKGDFEGLFKALKEMDELEKKHWDKVCPSGTLEIGYSDGTKEKIKIKP